MTEMKGVILDFKSHRFLLISKLTINFNIVLQCLYTTRKFTGSASHLDRTYPHAGIESEHLAAKRVTDFFVKTKFVVDPVEQVFN